MDFYLLFLKATCRKFQCLQITTKLVMVVVSAHVKNNCTARYILPFFGHRPFPTRYRLTVFLRSFNYLVEEVYMFKLLLRWSFLSSNFLIHNLRHKWLKFYKFLLVYRDILIKYSLPKYSRTTTMLLWNSKLLNAG